MYLIYKITNNINQKNYIGLTSKTVEERFKQHIDAAVQCKDSYAFHAAIRKYGYMNFTYEVLENNLTLEQAKDQERYYVQLYNSYVGNGQGYNGTFGGDYNEHMVGENNPVAKLTQYNIDCIYNLLEYTNVPMEQIPELLCLPVVKGYIQAINNGTTWHNPSRQYPIRKEAKTISKQGENNPSAKLGDSLVLQIIDDLLNTSIPQTQLAKKYNVSYNTINGINRCKNWTHLHNYKTSIRDGI